MSTTTTATTTTPQQHFPTVDRSELSMQDIQTTSSSSKADVHQHHHLHPHEYKTVRDLIQHQTLLTIEPNRTLDRALQMMTHQNIRHLPVVTKHTGALVGIITERDLRLASISPIIDKDMKLDEALKKLSEHTVHECMSKSVHTVLEDDTILTAAKLMRVSKRGALPVLSSSPAPESPVADASKRVVGIITRSDLLDHLIRVLEPLEEEENKQKLDEMQQ